MGALARVVESDILPGHYSPVQSIAFGSDPDLIATGDTQRRAKVWYRGDLQFEINLSSRWDKVKPTERIRGLAFSPGGETLYTACGDQFRAHGMTTGEVRWAYQPARSFGFLIISPIALSVARTGEIAMATDMGRLSIWTPDGAMKAHWSDNDNPRYLAFVDGERVIGTDSFSLCTWNSTLGRKQSRLRLAERAYAFVATPDGRRVCLRSLHAVELLDGVTQEVLETYPLDFGPPLVSISDDGARVAVAGLNEVRVYDVGTPKPTRLGISTASPRSLKLSPNGHQLATGCSDGTVRFWDLD